MITAIIVDDEKSGRETLCFILEKHFPKVQVLAMAASVQEAIGLVEKYQPQLVFLDIEMPDEPGLSLATKVEVNFEIIVTTAHREYGIDAIKAGVADYLLKPVDIEELQRSLDKIEDKINAKTETFVLKQMISRAASSIPASRKIPLLVGNNKTIYVEAQTIVRCEASGNYTEIWLTNGKMELITRLIKEVEEQLAGFDFFRVHKSHLINIDHVKAHLKSEDNITMIDDSVIPLSRNMKADFLKRMNSR